MSSAEIQRRFGAGGIRDFVPAYGCTGAITDDTQMTLFTAEGILRAHVRLNERGLCNPFWVMRYAYERWLATQGERPPSSDSMNPDSLGWLYGVKEIHSRRAPGNTCLTALRLLPQDDARCAAKNDSKGCGGVMRVAPIGLIETNPFDLASGAAAITHGHPLGYESAGAMAVLVARALEAETLERAVTNTLDEIAIFPEIAGWVRRAADLAASNVPASKAIVSLGQGWVAEEALAIGVFCALRGDTMEEAIVMAVNHSGDSDSTGSIAGQILGAHLGQSAIPRHWLEALELRNVVQRIAEDLFVWVHDRSSRTSEDWWNSYPGC